MAELGYIWMFSFFFRALSIIVSIGFDLYPLKCANSFIYFISFWDRCELSGVYISWFINELKEDYMSVLLKIDLNINVGCLYMSNSMQFEFLITKVLYLKKVRSYSFLHFQKWIWLQDKWSWVYLQNNLGIHFYNK